MDITNKIVLFSRMLRDLQQIPHIEDELVHWERHLATGTNFWSPLREVGVISWIGKPTTSKISFLPSKAQDSARCTKSGYRGFRHDVLSGHYMRWPKLETPEFSYLQDYFNDLLDTALTAQSYGATSTEMERHLEMPYNILHCLQLTFRNLAAEYLQMITILKNRRAGRIDYYLPHSNYGFTSLDY